VIAVTRRRTGVTRITDQQNGCDVAGGFLRRTTQLNVARLDRGYDCERKNLPRRPLLLSKDVLRPVSAFLESTVRYLGIEVDDALAIAEIWHETVIAVQPPHVCCRSQSGKHVLGESISHFDP
jgi:hypothetical protein